MRLRGAVRRCSPWVPLLAVGAAAPLLAVCDSHCTPPLSTLSAGPHARDRRADACLLPAGPDRAPANAQRPQLGTKPPVRACPAIRMLQPGATHPVAVTTADGR